MSSQTYVGNEFFQITDVGSSMIIQTEIKFDHFC